VIFRQQDKLNDENWLDGRVGEKEIKTKAESTLLAFGN